MRKEFGKVITELVAIDKRIHLLSLDIGYGIFDKLKKEHPENYWNLGVTEQASIGLASGMALEGLKPYIYTITPFALERPFEQIKLDVMAQNAPVKIAGFWDYPLDGLTHKTRDVKGLCKILGIDFYEPKNSKELREMLFGTYNNNRPGFFNMLRNPEK